MATETIISTEQLHGETIQVIERVTYEKKEGRSYKITQKIKRVTKKTKPQVARRRALPRFGRATLPGNDNVTTIGPEVFIERPPYNHPKKRDDTSFKSSSKTSSKTGWGSLLSNTCKTRERKSNEFSSWMRKSQKPDEEWKRTLFVTNIPIEMRNDEALDYVTSICSHRPTRVHVIRNRDTDICYGNMIVVFNRVSNANQAVSELSGQIWNSNIINAQISKPKEKRKRRS